MGLKKRLKKYVSSVFIVIMAMSMVSCDKNLFNIGDRKYDSLSEEELLESGKFVEKNKGLQIKGTQICNAKGEEIQLKGMSSHGIGWYGDYINKDSMKYVRDEMGGNIIRLAMYTEEGNSYTSSPNTNKTKIYEGIDTAIELGMYIIVDWHILKDNDPNKHKEEAKEFFKEVTEKYKDCPNIIYEICNEPNGNNVTWSNSIKPYAEEVIPVIRENSPNSIIIVGTANWCQDILDPANDPLEFENILYACHFYSGTHTEWLRERVDQALAKGLPIIISEWGTSAADGNGGIFPEETLKWIEFLQERNISWLNWSLCNKGESSAALKPSATFDGNWSDDDLSESGKIVKEAMLNGAEGLKNYINNN